MDEAGASFTAEQTSQIQPLFDEQNKARKGLTDKAQIDQLERETLGKVLKLLTPTQRTALLAPPKL